MSTATTTSHLVIFTLSGWGHLRPYVHITSNLLSLNPHLFITLLADRRAVRRIPQELSAHPSIAKVFKDAGRVKIEALVDDGEKIPQEDHDKIAAEVAGRFDGVFERILKGEAEGGVPRTMLVDVMRVPQYIAKIRAMADGVGLTRDKFKILVGSWSLACAFISYFDDVIELRELEKAGDKAGIDAVTAKAHDRDTIRDRPDVGPMRGFEIQPQQGAPADTPEVALRFRRMLQTPILEYADGLVLQGTPEIEEEASKLLPEISGMPLYSLGYLPSQRKTGEGEEIPCVVNNPYHPTNPYGVKSFLEKCGPRTVAYISFGSFCWPTGHPEIVETLIFSLLAAKPPLAVLLSVASPDTKLSDSTRMLMEDSRRVVVSSWFPQKTVLAHPATSFFITHVGCGSMYEAIHAKVPMITVPQYADQPIAAALMTKLGVGIQLYQFTTGQDGRTFANGVKIAGSEQAMRAEMDETWAKVRGKEGDTMRENLEALDETISKSAASGGAQRAYQELLDLTTRA